MVRTKVFDKIGFLNEELRAWTDDSLVVPVVLNYPVIHCGTYIALVHKSEESMTGNKWNAYQGLSVMIDNYKKEIISEVSLWRYILWKIRLLAAFCYAKETTCNSRIMYNIWNKLHCGIRWFWHKHFMGKFE